MQRHPLEAPHGHSLVLGPPGTREPLPQRLQPPDKTWGPFLMLLGVLGGGVVGLHWVWCVCSLQGSPYTANLVSDSPRWYCWFTGCHSPRRGVCVSAPLNGTLPVT